MALDFKTKKDLLLDMVAGRATLSRVRRLVECVFAGSKLAEEGTVRLVYLPFSCRRRCSWQLVSEMVGAVNSASQPLQVAVLAMSCVSIRPTVVDQ